MVTGCKSGWMWLFGLAFVGVAAGGPEWAGSVGSGGGVAAQAAVVYVSTAGNDTNNGLSWAMAKKTVQAGLNAATVADQVWVATGVYVESVTLKDGVELYGGFAGSETSLGQRNWKTNVTVLDGNQSWGMSGPCVTVVTGPVGATASTRIDGFTIRNGRGDYGGGIYCYNSSPTIANNTITGNTAGYGGGIYCEGSSAVISGNTITENTAYDYEFGGTGGGIHCVSSNVTITNNIITGNDADSAGGIKWRGGAPRIVDNIISGNSAMTGGGISFSSSSPVLANNTIVANYAGEGGGIICSSSWPTIVNNIVAFNSSGICVNGSSTVTARCNCVYGNTDYNYSGIGDQTGSNGNISVDPQMASAVCGNAHLLATSPCVDSGDDGAVLGGERDMDGQARITGKHVDIGVDEFDPADPLHPGGAKIVRVAPEGNDTNDGSSWGQAKRTVQGGIDAADPGGEVWVKEGTYGECVRMQVFVHLYGGFGGTETERSQRDWRRHVTVLDGQRSGTVVVLGVSGHHAATVDGLTIRGGYEVPPQGGGGIYCTLCSPTIANNTITGNDDSEGGAIDCYQCSPVIVNNVITGNSASWEGGGIFCYRSFPRIAGNTITGNIAPSGGGIYCVAFGPTITNNTIAGNSASVGGGIYCVNSATISNNTITGNTASSGGGIYCYSFSGTISNNTVTGNTASSNGGGIYSYSSWPSVTSTIIAFNSSGIYRDSSSGTLTLRYCCVYGNSAYNYSGVTDPTDTNGNISADPVFVLTPNAGPDGKWATADDLPGDLHLTPGSPCINAGDPAYVPATGETDMDGQPRVIGGRVDIGADEFWLAGDANYDGFANVGDLQLLIQAWGKKQGDVGYSAGADCNGDGSVNVGDLQVLVANWGKNS